MSRNGLLLITIVALQMQGLAQHLDSVQAMLALKDGKTTYRLGEGIVLDLSFTANELGYLVDTTTEPASPIDKITISLWMFVLVAGGFFTRTQVFSGLLVHWGTFARHTIAHPAAAERGLPN